MSQSGRALRCSQAWVCQGNPATGLTQLSLVSAIALRGSWDSAQPWAGIPRPPPRPHTLGPGRFPPGLGESKRFWTAQGAGDRPCAPLLPSALAYLNIALGGEGRGPLLAPPASPRALGATPKPPPTEVFGNLVSNSLSPSSGT